MPLSQNKVHFLVSGTDFAKTKDVAWSCGSYKALGPDGYTFSFIKPQWKVLKTYIMECVLEFIL